MMLKLDKNFSARVLTIYFLLPLFLDRISKHFIVQNIVQSRAVTSFFNICFTMNRGIAWSMWSDLDDTALFLMMCFIVIILLYFAWYIHLIADHKGMLKASLIILSGAISNFIDRLWVGGVVDFIQFHLGLWYFPIFNIADVAITLGAIFLTIFFFKEN